jgi:AraC family transcriptional regulator
VQPNTVLFVEPETPQGRALTERWLRDGIAEIPAEIVAEVAPALFAAWSQERSAAAVEQAARRVIHTLTGGVVPGVVSDERILRAIAHIRTHLDRPITLDEAADVACLSPSRFRHLFVEQTGSALRPYILWRRFLHVWELLMAGESLSTAAHSAGFADAAHLTRTCRQMFGFPPSAMQMLGPLRPDGDTRSAISRDVARYDASSQPLRSIPR